MHAESFQDLLSLAKANAELQTRLAETLLSDMVNQLDVLDPTDDGEELLELFQDHGVDGRVGEAIFCFLLGVRELDEYAQNLLEDLQEDLDE